MTDAVKPCMVVPLLRAVAAGVRVDKSKQSWLRLTLVATPAASDGEGACPLQDWPGTMLRRASELTIKVRHAPVTGPIPSLSDETQWRPLPFKSVAIRLTSKELTEIGELWRSALGIAGAEGWAELTADIDRSLRAEKHVAGDLRAPEGPERPAGANSGPELGPEGGLSVPRRKPDDVALIKGVVPLAQTALALEAETVRAARVFALMQKGPFVLDREEEPVDRKIGIAEKVEITELRQQAFYDAHAAVDAARRRSADHFDSVKAVMSGGTPNWAATSGTPLVPDPDLVRKGRENCPLEASHVYGTWLQAKTKAADTREPTAAPSNDASSAAACVVPQPVRLTAAITQELHARFYAIQGDHMLSRLFGLCIDLEIELKSSGLQQGTLHIAAEMAGVAPPRGLPLVITAARLEREQFWPCSMFEPGGMVAHCGNLVQTGGAHLVSQSHGVWCMAGTSDAAQAQRFELASLDIRGATERARARPGGRPGSAGDKGEQHRTTGFTIMDRQRADETARDLAIAAAQSGAVCDGGKVVLHAEELTIGRRVDIAAVKPGDSIKSVQDRWRSLMGRIVRLSFPPGHQAAAQALDKLVPPRPGGLRLEDGSFQTGARLLPKLQPPDGRMVPYEALVEEAIFTWDGTPAGALTDVRQQAAEPSDYPAVPWSRQQRPPLQQDGPRLRPAPLRYGMPYLFGFTSVFLGGIAPSVAIAAALRGMRRTAMLPTAGLHAKAGQEAVRPRRFLRQEGIGAPLLMFPRNMALRQHGTDGVLGYEPLDTAILRTVCPSPFAATAGSGPPASERAGPESTRRVFLPPELALDAVARHGMLDGPDPGRVVRGGLRNVTFRPRHTNSGRVAQGFPAVQTVSTPGMRGEPVTVRRKVTLGLSNESVMPLFEPGQNTVGAQQPGYLPDPAAEFYCLRARIAGSDRYLVGCREVAVFPDHHAYPDAVPLVLELRKGKTVRTKPATAITELILISERRAWMLPGGGLAATGAAGGAPVTVVVLALAPGEEFDLEVTCLPKPETLACWFAVVETMAAQWRAAEMDCEARRRLHNLTGPLESLPAVKAPFFTAICEQPIDAAAIEAVAGQLSHTMRQRWPIQELAFVGKLRIAHAVNLPATPPVLQALTTRRPPAPEKGRSWLIQDTPGSTTMLLEGSLLLDLEQVSAVELVAWLVPAAGEIDDATRSRSRTMRRSGRWPWTVDENGVPVPEEVQAVLGFRVDGDGKVTLLQEKAQLLRIDDLPTHQAVPPKLPFGLQQGRLTELDLRALHEAAVRGMVLNVPVGSPEGAAADVLRQRGVRAVQHQVLTGTRARRLTVQVVTISRHAAAFETAPRFVPSGTPLYRRRTPLATQDQSLTWPIQSHDGQQGWTTWVKATERPPPPEPLRPELSFDFEETSKPIGATMCHTLTRTTKVRLWFKRGWFASGEGERLGIVLWPPCYRSAVLKERDERVVRFAGRDILVADLDDADLGPGGAFVTRWGGDPIRGEASPQQGMLIPPSAFAIGTGSDCPAHEPCWVDEVLMPRAAGDDGEGSTETGLMPVSLLTFEPYFDLDREQWFVDVPLEPIRATEPFARFGLVRYQEQAVRDTLQVSRPVTVMATMLPKRTVTATTCLIGKTINLVIRVDGGGSLGAMLPDWQEAASLVPEAGRAIWSAAAQEAAIEAARPVMRLTLLHERKDEDGQMHRLPVPKMGSTVMAREEINRQLRWHCGPLMITEAQRTSFGHGRYVCIVEEVDRRMPAAYEKEPIDVETMFRPDCFVDSGPRFLGSIVVFEDCGQSNKDTEPCREWERQSAPPVSR